MRVGVVADSAGDLEALKRAYNLLMGTLACERFFFLGGNWVDVEGIFATTQTSPEVDFTKALTAFVEQQTPPPLGEHIVRVTERAGPGGEDNLKSIDMLGPSLCLLVHNKADLTKDDITNAHIIFHGRGKAPAVVRIGPKSFITPGAVAGADGTVAVLSQSGASLEVEFYDLQGQRKSAETVSLASGTRMSVR